LTGVYRKLRENQVKKLIHVQFVILACPANQRAEKSSIIRQSLISLLSQMYNYHYIIVWDCYGILAK